MCMDCFGDQNEQNYYLQQEVMSQSSLPDIFRRCSTIPVKLARQGPSFSLHLASTSPEKYTPSRAGFAPGELNFTVINSQRARTSSLQQITAKQSLLRSSGQKGGESSRSKMRITFKEDVELMTNGPLKQKIGLSVVNCSQFPYETNRRFHNNTIDMEEADNLSNKIDAHLNEMEVISSQFQESKEMANKSRHQLLKLGNKLSQQLDNFTLDFQESLRQCYTSLSSLRRQTQDELKSNKLECQKVKNQFNTCIAFSNDLKQKLNNMQQQYVKTSENVSDINMSARGDMILDFAEISTIRKSSRGATGDISRRTKRNEYVSGLDRQRKSDDLKIATERENKFVLNGKEVDLLHFDDEY